MNGGTRTRPQSALFNDPATPHSRPLTVRQQLALDLVRNAGRRGLPADDVGAAWCAQRGKHPAEDRCQWCGISGREVLRRLRQLGHVKSRRDGTWYALHDVVEPDRPDEEIPY